MIKMASMWSMSSRSTFLAIRQPASQFVHDPIRPWASFLKKASIFSQPLKPEASISNLIFPC